jgi:hypothetical protein
MKLDAHAVTIQNVTLELGPVSSQQNYRLNQMCEIYHVLC